MRFKTIRVPMTEAEEAEEDRLQRENRYRHGAARPEESCEQANIRMGWGCKCHGMTFCPDLKFVGYDEDVPVFERKDR